MPPMTTKERLTKLETTLEDVVSNHLPSLQKTVDMMNGRLSKLILLGVSLLISTILLLAGVIVNLCVK